MHQRKHKRHSAQLSVAVRVAGWDDYIRLYTQDLSIGGMFIESDSPPEVFSDLVVRIVLPDDAGELSLAAEVVHVVTPEEAELRGFKAGMGVQFEQRSEADQEKLELLLKAVQEGQTDQIAALLAQTNQGQGANAELVEALVARSTEIQSRDPLDVFGLTRCDTIDTLRAVFLRLAKDFHPQRFTQHNDPVVNRSSHLLFSALEEAYINAKEDLIRARRAVQQADAAAAADTSAIHQVLPADGQVEAALHPTEGVTVSKPQLDNFTAEMLAAAAQEGLDELNEPVSDACDDEAPVRPESQLKVNEALRYLSRKTFDDAIELLNEAVALDPNNKSGMIWLRVAKARKALAKDDKDEALAIYQSILDDYDAAHHESLAAVGPRGHGAGSLKERFSRFLGRKK